MGEFSNSAAACILLCGIVSAMIFVPTLAQSCARSITLNRSPKTFSTCTELGSLGASLSWSLFSHNHTLEMVFSASALSASGWVGWGLNLGPAPVMNGSSTLIAFRASNGSNLLQYKLTEEILTGALPSCSPIDLRVLDQAVEISGNAMKIYAVLQLQPNQTVLNHIWNRGSGVTQFKPLAHDFTDKGSLQLDMATGTVTILQPPNQLLKNRHAIINVVGWGMLLPLGVIAARYLRPFEAADPAWFYMHIFFQSAGYMLGVAGWVTGLRLGRISKGVVFYKHLNIGISIFTLATLQIVALIARPAKDHKLRQYWNVYHHTIGYTTIILAIINIFEGLHILQPKRSWKNAYLGILIGFGGVSLILEILTWVAYFHSRNKSHKSLDQSIGHAKAVIGKSNTRSGFLNGQLNGDHSNNAHDSSA